MTAIPSPTTARLGPIKLAPGVTRGNVIALLVGSFFTAIVSAYLSFAQPYILNEHLHLPTEIQGSVSGNLAFFTEIALIVLSGFMGAWSDRIGHRAVFVLGFLVIGLSYLLYPWATTTAELYGYRLVYAVGAAAIGAMFVAVQSDYPAEASRGLLVACIGILSILGFMAIVALLAPLPRRFVALGFGPVEAGRLAFGVIAVIAVVGAAILQFGLKARVAGAVTQTSLMARLRLGFLVARGNPRIGLAYVAGLVGRADLAIITIFLSLWITQVGRAKGLTTQQALVDAGAVFGVIQLSSLVFMPLLGYVADRIDRVTSLCIATAIAAVGYVWIGLLAEPVGMQAFPAAIVLGMGQAGVILTATALVGQEAPKEALGAVSGVFGISSAIGILVATKVGGWLFDAWMPGAPFIIMGAANAVVLAIALAVRLMEQPRALASRQD